jgi:hypothetical protein
MHQSDLCPRVIIVVALPGASEVLKVAPVLSPTGHISEAPDSMDTPEKLEDVPTLVLPPGDSSQDVLATAHAMGLMSDADGLTVGAAEGPREK